MKAPALSLPGLIRPALALGAGLFPTAIAYQKAPFSRPTTYAPTNQGTPFLRVAHKINIEHPRVALATTETTAGLRSKFQTFNNNVGTSVPSLVTSNSVWLDETLSRVDALIDEATIEEVPVPSDQVLELVRDAVNICADAGATQPSLANDDEGGVEIYLKEGTIGLLVSIQSNNVATIFGDDQLERWRGKYTASGLVWKTHLARSIADMLAA